MSEPDRERSAVRLAYGLLGIFGVGTGLGSPYTLLAMPLAAQEMVFAGRLIFKGLEVPQAQTRHSPAGLQAAG
jgi:hypothetical protein